MSKIDVIQSHVEVLMREVLGVDELHVCGNGEIPVHYRSVRYVVRVRNNTRTPHVEVYADVVEGVDADPGLYEAINSINRRLSHLRAFWSDRKVVLAGELYGPAIDHESLDCVCDEIAGVAHYEGPRLAKVFGGQVAFPDEVGEDG